MYSAEEMSGSWKSARWKAASDTASCSRVGCESLHWKLNTLGWLRRFCPMVSAESAMILKSAGLVRWLCWSCHPSQHWYPALTRMPARSICWKKPAGMMCPSRRIAFTPMFFISAICLAVSAAE